MKHAATEANYVILTKRIKLQHNQRTKLQPVLNLKSM